MGRGPTSYVVNVMCECVVQECVSDPPVTL